MELPIRIVNCSLVTIGAKTAHEWHSGEWPPTDLGAAVRPLDDKSGNWRVSKVYVSGERGGETGAEWGPGQSHDFLLRMNRPGTGSVRGQPLMDAGDAGKYAVRISLVFRGAQETRSMSSRRRWRSKSAISCLQRPAERRNRQQGPAMKPFVVILALLFCTPPAARAEAATPAGNVVRAQSLLAELPHGQVRHREPKQCDKGNTSSDSTTNRETQKALHGLAPLEKDLPHTHLPRPARPTVRPVRRRACHRPAG